MWMSNDKSHSPVIVSSYYSCGLEGNCWAWKVQVKAPTITNLPIMQLSVSITTNVWERSPWWKLLNATI